MRLLVATDSLGSGGAERQLVLTVTNLPRTWDVRCFSVIDGPFAGDLRAAGTRVDVVERRWRRDPLPFLRLWGIVARWRPQLVHSWGEMTTLAGFPAYRAFGVPYVDSTIRTGDVRISGEVRRRAGLDRATLVVANSRAGLESAGISARRGRVIYNAFDASRIPDEPPARTDDRFTIVMAARMTASKDFAALLAATRILLARPQAPALHVVLLGEGEDRAALEVANSDLAAAGVVEFGQARDVVPRLLTADCGVLMTRSHLALEGFPNAVMEYMACGLPVVCSSGGGTDELVADGQTGLLVPGGDAAALAERLSWVMEHREQAAEMGGNGARVIGERYSIAAMIRATEAVYAEALEA